jgi:hypothetical protein
MGLEQTQFWPRLVKMDSNNFTSCLPISPSVPLPIDVWCQIACCMPFLLCLLRGVQELLALSRSRVPVPPALSLASPRGPTVRDAAALAAPRRPARPLASSPPWGTLRQPPPRHCCRSRSPSPPESLACKNRPRRNTPTYRVLKEGPEVGAAGSAVK